MRIKADSVVVILPSQVARSIDEANALGKRDRPDSPDAEGAYDAEVRRSFLHAVILCAHHIGLEVPREYLREMRLAEDRAREPLRKRTPLWDLPLGQETEECSAGE